MESEAPASYGWELQKPWLIIRALDPVRLGDREQSLENLLHDHRNDLQFSEIPLLGSLATEFHGYAC